MKGDFHQDEDEGEDGDDKEKDEFDVCVNEES